jgi:hypothetical protein
MLVLSNSDKNLANKLLSYILFRHHISSNTHTKAYNLVRNNTHYNPPGIDSLLQEAPTFISVHIKFLHACLFALLSTCRNSTPASNIVIIFLYLIILLNAADTLYPKADIHNEAVHENLGGFLRMSKI